MSVFVDEVVKKLAEQWVRLLALPGLLFLCALVAAWPVRNRHIDSPQQAFGAREAARFIAQISDRVAAGGAVTLGLLLVGLLLGSIAIAQFASTTAGVVESAWLGDWWPPWTAKLPTYLRRVRWKRWDTKVEKLMAAGAGNLDLVAIAAAQERRNAIAAVSPQRPTWIGDRLVSTEALIRGVYHLDVRVCWPRLWMTLPDRAREDLSNAANDFQRHCLTAGWGSLCVIAGAYWWPIAAAGLVLIFLGWRRAREAFDQFVALVESAFDLYGVRLARALGLAVTATLDPAVGDQISALLDKSN